MAHKVTLFFSYFKIRDNLSDFDFPGFTCELSVSCYCDTVAFSFERQKTFPNAKMLRILQYEANKRIKTTFILEKLQSIKIIKIMCTKTPSFSLSSHQYSVNNDAYHRVIDIFSQ